MPEQSDNEEYGMSNRTDISITDVPHGTQTTDIAISDERYEGMLEVKDAKYAPLDCLAPGSREAQQRQRDTLEKIGYPIELCSKVVGIRFRLIPAGTFMMGSPENEEERDEREGPQHQVTISRPFYMGTFQVTQSQWQQVMGSNPSYSKGDDLPVESVFCWNDGQGYLGKLCKMEGVPKETYRLPTEAEWEYACRAGTTTRFYTGDSDGDLARAGWYRDNSGHKTHKTHPIGQKAPNAFGLYDMHGNVWEWCEDWYAAYASGNIIDPRGPVKGSARVLRGGSWYNRAFLCRSAFRFYDFPAFEWYSPFGFRLSLPAGQ